MPMQVDRIVLPDADPPRYHRNIGRGVILHLDRNPGWHFYEGSAGFNRHPARPERRSAYFPSLLNHLQKLA
jgi:hypothetical protein